MHQKTKIILEHDSEEIKNGGSFKGICEQTAETALHSPYYTCISECTTAWRPQSLAIFSITREISSQGRTNPAFSKPCLCLSDTRHFVIVVVFRGLRTEALVFSG